jgi:hypothetical protein
MVSRTTRITRICAISRAVNGKVMRVVVGDDLHYLQLFAPHKIGVGAGEAS